MFGVDGFGRGDISEPFCTLLRRGKIAFNLDLSIFKRGSAATGTNTS
jgi:hypothetical protein